MKIEERYLDGTYLNKNPDWDRSDSKWKAGLVKKILHSNLIYPNSIVEIGCGAGDVLRALRLSYQQVQLAGFDVSPQLEEFWREDHLGIDFHLGDFFEQNIVKFDVMLMLDVFEHVRDPFTFLEKSRPHANFFVFHIPLDLSAQAVVRSSPLLKVRRSVGHLHFYTKDLALETLNDCGYIVLEWHYSGISSINQNRSFRTRFGNLFRSLLRLLGQDISVRILGGETLVVLAKAKC